MDSAFSSDEIWVRKAREGDRNAFSVLVRRYQEQAVMMAHMTLRNWELAKDVSQNAFTKAYFGLKNFREDAQFKTWLFRIVLNEAKDAFRKERSRGLFKFVTNRSTEEGDSESILDLIPSQNESPRDVFEAKENKKKLEQAIYQLPERERDVFILRCFHELSLNEISEILGMAVGTVKAHLAQGTAKLKSLLAPEQAAVSGPALAKKGGSP